MKKLFCLMLALALLLCGCGTEAPAREAGSVTVTDMIGREVAVVPGSYTRVVCIGAGALRLYCYVGDTQLLCGVEDIDNTALAQRPQMFDGVARPYVLAYGDVFTQLPSCGVGGPQAQTAEAEKILSCEPDLVISQYEDVEKADALQAQLGVPVITLRTGADGVFDQAFAGSLQLLGKVLGREARAQELVDFVAQEQAAIQEKAATVTEKPLTYICGLGNWGTTNHLMTAEVFKPFQVAGVENVVSGLGIQGVGPIEEEKFVELSGQMDVMILDAAAVKNIKPLYAQEPDMFATCKAWNEGEVYLQMAYNAYYTNFEIALINTWFTAKAVYPDAFAEVDMTETTNRVTKAFLGQELAEEIFACPASFGGYGKIDTATFFAQ